MTINPKLLEPTVVWTNPNPNNVLSAGDNGNITSINNYTYIVIEAKITNDSTQAIQTFKFRTEAGKFITIGMCGNAGERFTRIMYVLGTGRIYWENGKTNGNDDSAVMIPVKVIGTNIL